MCLIDFKQEERQKELSKLTKLEEGTEGMTIQEQLLVILHAQTSRAMDLFKAWDIDHNQVGRHLAYPHA